MTAPMMWQEHAACRTVPLDRFYTLTSGHPHHDAAAACDRCPVLAECFADVLHLEHGQSVDFRGGYRAGTTPAQRVALTVQRRNMLAARVAEARALRHPATKEAAA